MLRSLTLLPTLVLLLGAPPDERLGVGVAIVPVEPGVRFGLFAEPGDLVPVATIELVGEGAPGTVALADPVPDWLRPEMLWLDFGILTFRVLRATDEGLEVVVDREGGRTLWLKRRPPLAFVPWAPYLIEHTTVIERLDPAANPLRLAPDGAAVPYDGPECIRPVAVRGEWLRVEPSEICGPGEPPSADTVEGLWLRWRAGDRLLIRYFLTC